MPETLEQRVEAVIPTVRALLFDTSSRLLMIKRGPGLDEGLWCLPGGKKDPCEEIYKAIMREVFEEVGLLEGLDFVLPGYFVSQKEINNSVIYVASYFLGKVINGMEANVKIDNYEAVAFRWNTVGEVLRSEDLAFNHGKGLKGLFASVLKAEVGVGSNVYK